MTELPAYVAQIEPDWIDYNGHLRDAYYCVVMSFAVDDVMEHLGLDAAYRERTHCTLYTVELHMHYFHEIKGTDELTVSTSVLDSDRKRIHAGCDFLCPRIDGPAATAELMLLHVQQGEKPSVVSFPAGNRATARELAALAGSGRATRCRLAQDRAQAPIGPMPASDIRRLIAPRSIALIGASAWTDAVAAGNATIGYRGTVWRVHPTRASTPERPFYRSVAELPGVPDAAFIAVPNHEAPAVAGALAARGAGGFVCFSSGFGELGTEVGRRLERRAARAGRRPALLRPELLRLREFLRSRGDAARSDRRRAARARRCLDLPERHHLAQLELQRALGADRLLVLGGQSEPARGRGSDRGALRRSARDCIRPVSRGHQGRGAVRRRGGQGAARRQADRRDQDRPHRRRGAHGA